ncbi:IS200/IS605 family transposase [Verrucomicrobium spinosum]|uniref:IS200/IS605 family transposase n=1 Tax=Verrucomicrobium spinosum TaxID=2736 RepID=UPI000174435C|nr:IS200/IS605 family transposase [Verrucomicrobium spinosum]
MPQSLSLVVVHFIFSTHDRFPCIGPSVRPGLHAYLAEIARDLNCDCYRVGGVSDHVHLAVRLARTISISEFVEKLKTGSSKWMKKQQPELGGFSWQRGYGAFSVAPADVDAVVAYIDNQEDHHRTRTFQDEYRAFLRKYGVEYNEEYVWD